MTTRSDSLFRRAERLMPGGVSSPVRAFGPVGGTPRFIVKAAGPYLYDADGCELIDLVGSWGAAIGGHAHPDVVDAIRRAAGLGTSFGLCNPLEADLAERIADRVPSVDMVRFVNSGTEAVISVIRLARAATGRSKIVKLDGCYHGHSDALLVQAGSGVATHAIPGTPGIAADTVRNTLTAPYNDVAALDRLFDEYGRDIAALLVEPVAGNMGLVPPKPGYLEYGRELCTANGSLLVFDEVMTGFRVAPAGAQGLYGVTPDITAFGKVIGGGLPVGAYGGPRDLMRRVAPAGDVYQAGTLSGNPLAMAAGIATLDLLTDENFAKAERAAAWLAAGLDELLIGRGCVQRVGAMLSVFFGPRAVTTFAEARAADHAAYARFFHAMLDRGVHLPPSGYEAWFPSITHDPPVCERILAAAADALRIENGPEQARIDA